MAYLVRFQGLTASNMEMTAVWDIASCIFLAVDRYFEGTYCLLHQEDDDGDYTHL